MDSLPRWFEGVKLNYAENILFAHKPGSRGERCTQGKEDSKIALTEVREGCREVKHITWGSLRRNVGLLSQAMRAAGVRKGDRVAGPCLILTLREPFGPDTVCSRGLELHRHAPDVPCRHIPGRALLFKLHRHGGQGMQGQLQQSTRPLTCNGRAYSTGSSRLSPPSSSWTMAPFTMARSSTCARRWAWLWRECSAQWVSRAWCRSRDSPLPRTSVRSHRRQLQFIALKSPFHHLADRLSLHTARRWRASSPKQSPTSSCSSASTSRIRSWWSTRRVLLGCRSASSTVLA